MQSIVQSYFLQALAWALINSIWQMGLLWLAIIFFFRVLQLSSSQKFTVAFTVQFFGFILFIYSLIKNFISQTSIEIFKPADSNYTNFAANYFKYIMPFIAIIYIVVLVWHILKLTFNYKLTQDLRKNNLVKIPAANRVFVEELITVFSLHRKVKIYLSEKVKCPVTIGFFKPVILIPLAAINYLTKEQMEAVILHEMAHIKRADYLLNLLQYVIRKVFFFNIFSKMMNDIIERERENACDDWVVQFKYNSFHYAEALLKIARLQTFSSFAMAASGKNENILFQRVKRLIHPDNNNSYQYTSLRFSFFASLIALGLIISFSSKISGTNNYSEIRYQSAVVSEKSIYENFKKTNSPFQTGIFEKNIPEPGHQQKKIIANNATNKTIITASKNLNKIRQPEHDFSQKENMIYSVSANQLTDSLKQLPYPALNKQFTLNKSDYKKALSYKNFKQLEAMLVLTGDSVNIVEDPNSTDNYKKLITIETTDKDGNTNIYQVIVELYQ